MRMKNITGNPIIPIVAGGHTGLTKTANNAAVVDNLKIKSISFLMAPWGLLELVIQPRQHPTT
jgi:hypothetical protein